MESRAPTADVGPGVPLSEVMSLEEKVANFVERTVYGRGAFSTEAATLRTLIKFFEDHQSPVPAESPLRKCLAALEAGEKSSAIEAYKRINRGGMWGIGDWTPPVACSCETGESVSITFMALLGAWLRLMSALADERRVAR
jgi:hypothetical protein